MKFTSSLLKCISFSGLYLLYLRCVYLVFQVRKPYLTKIPPLMFEGKYGRYCIVDGILFVEYKADLIFTLKVARRIVQERIGFQHNKEYPVFCKLSGMIDSQSEARHYLAQEGAVFVKALAFHVTSPVATRLTEFYIQTLDHQIPTQSFNDRNQAIQFLKPYSQRSIN